MNEYQKSYYFKMKERNRVFPLRRGNGKIFGLITFYIGNGNPEKYEREDMWQVLEDEGERGDTCYIDHLLSDGKSSQETFRIWRELKSFIKNNFPKVNTLRWNRYKDNKPYIFRKELK